MNAPEFWNWFSNNKDKYFFLNQVDSEVKEKLLNEFEINLHKFCDSLFFEIGGFPDKTQELIITAEGNIEYFDKVEELVNSAPKLKDWNIIAFKPPMDFGFSLTFEGITSNASDLWFLPLENNDNPELIGLRIGFPNYKNNKVKEFRFIAYLILDTILGEKSNALDIAYLDVDLLPQNPDENGYLNLKELFEYVSYMKKNEKDKNTPANKR
jgi:hypothetical protein